MADCKACGAWFSSTAPDELCPTCGRALKRLNGYAVPVVRCKDCKHFIQEEHGCNHFGYYSHTPWVDEVDFCSYGEKED